MMKLSKYKILFISPFSDKTFQIEFSKTTFIVSCILLTVLTLSSISLLFLSSPIVKEYLRITAINNEIKQQKEIINNIDETIDEISIMKSYIDSIIGTNENHNLNEDKIRYLVTNNLPSHDPTNGLISREFNEDEKHLGMDIVNEESTPIFAVADARVIFSDFSKDFGNFLILDHQNGYITHYYHNLENFSSKGDFVKKGDVIATMGNTGMSSGPHLHFEIWKDGKVINPKTFYKDFKLKSDKLSDDETAK